MTDPDKLEAAHRTEVRRQVLKLAAAGTWAGLIIVSFLVPETSDRETLILLRGALMAALLKDLGTAVIDSRKPPTSTP